MMSSPRPTSVIFAVLFFSLICIRSFAQSGEIQGRITDKNTGEGIPFANIIVEMNGYQRGGSTSDFDGFFSIRPLQPGKYDVKISYVGYQPSETKGVIVAAEKATILNIQLNAGITLTEFEVTEYKIPLIDPGQTSTGTTITQEQIANLPVRSLQSLTALSSGVVQADAGKDIYIKGSRSNANVYIIDGVKVSGANTLLDRQSSIESGLTSLPASGIEQVSVITGGIPAKYGDVTGGVIEITTRGPSKKFSVGGELVTSQFLDPYRYNLGSLSLSGPILMKNKGTQMERPLLGFFAVAEYEWIKEPAPSAAGAWKVKDNKLSELIDKPLVVDKDGNIRRQVEYITKSDLEHVKARPGVAESFLRFSGKLDYSPAKNINLTLGGTFNYGNQRLPVYDYTMFNWDNHPIDIQHTWRIYGRLTHRLFTGKASKEKSAAKLVIQNAYYTLQVDFTKDQEELYHPKHKRNFFDYGYLGKFTTYRGYSWDTTNIIVGNDTFLVWANRLPQDTLVKFEPGGYNLITENITYQYYQLLQNPPANIDVIQTGPGMINGTRVDIENQAAYRLFAMPGRNYNGYYKRENDRIGIGWNGSFDIRQPGASERKKHSIQTGFDYEKYTYRYYTINPIRLWELMRQSLNLQIQNLNTATPAQWLTDTTGGINSNDTVWLERAYSSSLQKFFDISLRKKLGLAVDDRTYLDIDTYTPETFSLDMFSADELIEFSNIGLYYYGYDYLGNKYKKQPKFEEYFRAKDKDGNNNFTRPTGGYQPIYSAFYLQDQFYFKDINFNIGFRLDRFNANEKKLIDPYSLYPIKTAGEITTVNGKPVTHPSNIGDDYAVYVDNVTNPTKIIGYRKEDSWFDSQGSSIPGGDALAGGSGIQPYLDAPLDDNPKDDIRDPQYDLSRSFEDYQPQHILMPRVAFSFPVSDVAQFFAHYDVLTQRPTGNFSTPRDFYFLVDNTSIANPGLKPQRTVDYQIGYKQKVSRTSALTFSGFYREIKDMIQQRKVYHAYPTTYLTYANVDFGTVKGLTLTYDLRRINNISLSANYTLQFAEGTGSTQNSQSLLLSINQTLKTIMPLDFDQRHVIMLEMDYRYGQGKEYNGPKWLGKDILANAGVNVIMRAGSGFPYSRYSEPWIITGNRTSHLVGAPNSSRLPWTFKVDFKVDKFFRVALKKKTNKYLNMTAYLVVQNLFNNKNVLWVHKATGSPEDDGYLASPGGLTNVAGVTPSSASFVDMYSIYVADQPAGDYASHYGLPRMTRLGVIVGF